MSSVSVFFFFQAEDGIRDLTVTGVQTCALPISSCPVLHKPEVWSREAAQIWEDGAEIAAVNSKPGCECGEVLVDGRGRDPAASVGVIGAIDRERGPRAVSFSAINSAAHNEMVRTPAVIAAAAIGREGAAEVARGQRRDVYP